MTTIAHSRAAGIGAAVVTGTSTIFTSAGGAGSVMVITGGAASTGSAAVVNIPVTHGPVGGADYFPLEEITASPVMALTRQ